MTGVPMCMLITELETSELRRSTENEFTIPDINVLRYMFFIS